MSSTGDRAFNCNIHYHSESYTESFRTLQRNARKDPTNYT